MQDTQNTIASHPLRRLLWVFAICSLLPLLIVSATNFKVDPFMYFRISDPPRFSNYIQRYQPPGMIRNYDFDTLVVGNSVMSNFQDAIFDGKEFAVKPRVMNLSMWGTTIREDAYVVSMALAERPIKTVYWSIGMQSAIEEFRYPDFPKCMYGGLYRFIPPYCYLLNANVFLESLSSLPRLSAISRAGWVTDLAQWKTYGLVKMDPHAYACQQQPMVKNQDLDGLTQIAASNLGPAFDAGLERYRSLVLSLVRAHPKVRFVFLFAPVHLSHFWQFAIGRGSLRNDRALVDLFMHEPNAEVYDMRQLTDITHDLGRWRDDIHPDAESSREVVAALASGRARITSIPQYEAMLRGELEAGDRLMHSYAEEKCP